MQTLRTKYIIILFFILLRINGQDVYFSQFYNSPLTLNPALSGFYSGDVQAAINYRNYTQGLIPSSTFAASGDIKILPLRFNPDVFSIGFMAMSDQTLNGGLKRQSFFATAAYHLAIGSSKKHFISSGIQLGFYQVSVDFAAFSFESQWVNLAGYNPSISNLENFSRDKFFKPDINAGALYYGMITDNVAAIAGFSVFHLNQPNESISGSIKDPYKGRYVFHGGPRFLLPTFTVSPNLIVMMHNGARQIAEGLSFQYKIGETGSTIDIGSWYRHSDHAIIFSTGFSLKGFHFEVSSDFASNLQKISRTPSTLEFSLIYNRWLRKKATLNANPRNKY